MTAILLCLLFPLADDPKTEALAKAMLPTYVREAADYTIAVESAPKQPLKLKREPVFEWSNPAPEGLQQGVVFVWLRDGRPAAVGSVFSHAHLKPAGRKVVHELHALDPVKLLVTRPEGSLNEWVPRAGLGRKELADAPAPAATAGGRLLQMKRLAQEFTGHEFDGGGKRGELRVLPAPLYRYPEAKSGVTDGALFTLVSTTGTDPEVLLLIEARLDDGVTRWEYACARFSDWSLHVQRKGKDTWSSVRGEDNAFLHDALHLYRLYGDKVVNLDGKLLARIRTTDAVSWGEVVPVGDK